MASNRPDFEDIKRSTAGIVFLGTPHAGTDVAGYAAFIATLKRNDPSLVKSLKPIDKGLYDLSMDFAAGYKTLKVMCFYEKVGKLVGHFTRLTVSILLEFAYFRLAEPVTGRRPTFGGS